MKLNLIGQTAVVNKNMGVTFYDNKTKQLTAKPYTNLNQVVAEITSVLNTNHIAYKDLQHDNYCYGYNSKDDTFVVYLSAGSNFSNTHNEQSNWLVIHNFHNWCYMPQNRVGYMFLFLVSAKLAQLHAQATFRKDMLSVYSPVQYGKEALQDQNRAIKYLVSAINSVGRAGSQLLQTIQGQQPTTTAA